jgi:L-serine dehydratase
MRAREAELLGSQEAADKEMEKVLATMKEETHDTIEHPVRSLGGFLFGQAAEVAASSSALLGSALTKATAYAMAVLERSSAMGVIVAAPTAGASGVVPGAVLAAAEELGSSEQDMASALWTSAAIGALIAEDAGVAGAEGGCQAEVGTASAMAAGALAELLGGTPEEALAAASIAIGNLLGLVCDPVQGLVEYPCQLRNAIGVASAMSAAQLAHAGIRPPLPFDEVVDAMAKVGHALPAELRETALGGLAAEPSAHAGCTACGA